MTDKRLVKDYAGQQWFVRLGKILKQYRPDLVDEWAALYHGPPFELAVFLDRHFPTGSADDWAFMDIELVPDRLERMLKET